MAAITIRGLDEKLKAKLRVRAAQHGRSMEAEVREILQKAVQEKEQAPPKNLATAIREIFGPLGGVELERLPRLPIRPPPTFE
jgi:antitoxin FitA